MNVEITDLELQSLRNASAWLGLLADRDGDEDGHEGLKADKRGIDRIISKAGNSALPNRKPRTTGRQARQATDRT